MEVFIGILGFIALWLIDDVGAIINGKIAKPGQFPYQVLLKMTQGNWAAICGGAVIDEFLVLTAWHCVDGYGLDDIEVVLGAVKYVDDPNAVSYKVRKITLHESRVCRPDKRRCYDIAVLTMATFITYTNYIDEVSLPTSDITPGDECVFAGWGPTEEKVKKPSDVLRYGHGLIRSRQSCAKWFPLLENYEFCFQPRKDDKTTLNDGDSGAPFVCNGVLTGIAIRGNGKSNTPVVLINVYELMDFIFDVKHQDCLSEDEDPNTL